MVVYKLYEYFKECPRSGLVIKETTKQYRIRERHWSKKDFTGYESTWNKNDCFTDIDSASAALIAKAEQNIINKRRDLDRAISALDVCKKWAKQETLALKTMEEI